MVSIIIPVKNGEGTLEKCLSSIKRQTIANKLEIIVLDSCSTDKSVEIAVKYNARVINIPEGTFNHGLTRNIGVQYANCETLYFTVQDAHLAEADQLEKMEVHFTDENLQAVVGMQAVLNDVDKNPAKWFKRVSIPSTSYWCFPNGSFSKLASKNQFSCYNRWDNVNAMYRTTSLKLIPFIETSFAEDKFWAKDALQAGLKIAFDPSLVVYHYHHYNFKYAFKVQYIVNYSYHKFLGTIFSFPPVLKPLLIAIYRIVKNDKLSFKKKVYWLYHNLTISMGEFTSNLIFSVIAKYFGENVLNKSYRFFCKEVPQGKTKYTLLG